MRMMKSGTPVDGPRRDPGVKSVRDDLLSSEGLPLAR